MYEPYLVNREEGCDESPGTLRSRELLGVAPSGQVVGSGLQLACAIARV